MAFMITGMVSFGADKPVEEMNDFEKAEHYLTGINTKQNFLSDLEINLEDNRKITVNSKDNKITFSGFKNKKGEAKGNGEITINPKLLSDETWKNIETAIKNAQTNGLTTEVKTENTGVLDNLSHLIMGTDIVNKGIVVGEYTQIVSTTTNSQAENYGILRGTVKAQYINNASDCKIYNYGLIIGNQEITNNSNYSYAENSGLILGRQNLDGGQENKVINYGVISSSEEYGQIIRKMSNKDTQQKNNNAINYGIIKIDNNNNQSGQIIKGYVDLVASGDEHVMVGSKTNNNGYTITIRNGINAYKDKAEGNKGFNYGTIIVDTATNQQTSVKVFEGDVTNNGIVILDKYQGTDLTNITLGNKNNGIVFSKKDGNYSLINKDTVAEITDKNISNDKFNGKTTAYVTGTGNKIESLSNKVVGTVVKDNISEKGAVITADKDLTFENTVITGYFENNGTLLDMGKHNLSLLGDTNKGFNYGTVIVENATQTSVKVFEGDVTNNGIVILDKYQGTVFLIWENIIFHFLEIQNL